MSRLVGPQGVRGIDVTTERGTKAYNADSKGFINIENPKHAAQAKAEGFFEASSYSAVKAKGFPCSCGFNAMFRICGKCGKDNG